MGTDTRALPTLTAPTRRQFLQGAAGLTLSVTLGGAVHARATAGQRDAPIALNAYVHIAPDDTITICCPSAEMGQGVLTALPLIVAEEMDADWDRVRVEHSPPLGDVYGDPVFLNMIFTVASRAVPTYWDRLRLFGAQARRVLVMNAAEKWSVPAAEVDTEPGSVVHRASGRRLTYGEIARFATVPEKLPDIAPAELKPPSAFRLIGKVEERKDVPSKVDGALRYSIDVTLPGMVHACVLRAPFGAQLASVGENGARALPGVVEILRRDRQVAVIARSHWEALRARDRISVEWTRGEGAGFDSDRGGEACAAAARDHTAPGQPWDAGGDVGSGFAGARQILEREYRTDYMYHAGMEPLNAVVWVKDGGRSAEAWVGTQAPSYTIDAIAKATGVSPENVTLHRTLLGGAFGRRSIYGMDFVEDAAWISRELGRPVKVIWTREDDVVNGHFRPMTVQFLRAALDDSGVIGAWHHRVACEDPIRRFEPPLHEAWHGLPLIGMHAAEHQGLDRKPLAYAYDLPNRLVEYVPVEAPVRVYAMRGVGSVANKFAIESFIDELAGATGSDPLEYRLRLLHRSPRAAAVLQAVADMAGWGTARADRGLGLSYAHYGGSLVACVVEVSVDTQSGRIRLHNAWIAADVGIAIQPDNVKAQLEGGAIFGLSNALMERITFRDGKVMQSNYHDYPVMRMGEAPAVEVRLLPSDEPPTGVGETGTVVAAAALANAVAAVTGRRARHMPFTPERVKALLA